MPRPARRMGTRTSFFPRIRWARVLSRGVRISTSSVFSSRVASKAMSMAISLASSLNSLMEVF